MLDREAVNVSVTSVTIHDDWNLGKQSSYDADIAILDLSREIKFSNIIQPICLAEPYSEEMEISEGWIIGFGASENNLSYENNARIISSPIKKYKECVKIEDLTSLVSSRTFCGGDANGKSPCVGDSGGGLIVKIGRNYYLRGIVSSSSPSATAEFCNFNQYAVFTEVSRYNSWIISGGLSDCEKDLKKFSEKFEQTEQMTNELTTKRILNVTKEENFLWTWCKENKLVCILLSVILILILIIVFLLYSCTKAKNELKKRGSTTTTTTQETTF